MEGSWRGSCVFLKDHGDFVNSFWRGALRVQGSFAEVSARHRFVCHIGFHLCFGCSLFILDAPSSFGIIWSLFFSTWVHALIICWVVRWMSGWLWFWLGSFVSPGPSCLLLASPGSSWFLLALPGSSWLFLAPSGSSWLLGSCLGSWIPFKGTPGAWPLDLF